MRIPSILVLALVPSLSGCVAAAVAVGAGAAYSYVQYDKNEAYQDFRAEYDEAWAATVEAVRDNGFLVQETPDPVTSDGIIKSDNLRVQLQQRPEGLVRVSVRVGTFESEENLQRSTDILKTLEQRLGEPQNE